MRITERVSRYRAFTELLARCRGIPDSATDESVQRNGDEPSARQFAADLEALGPTFIKLGQLLASRADLLPPAYIDALTRLQDNVAPFPASDALAILEEDLGVRPSKVFPRFDDTPVAAASLGQVHRAVTRDGRPVAVKIQRPGVRDRVLDDLDALGDLASLLQRLGRGTQGIDLPAVLAEFRRTLLDELDYRQEARHMALIAHQLRDFESVIVPLPIDDLTGPRVLTMDYVEGTALTRVVPVQWTEVDGAALADTLFRAYLRQVLVHGCFHADPHPGNVLLTPDHRLALVDLGMVGRLSAAQQEQLFRLVLAVAEGRSDDAAWCVMAMGERLDDFQESTVRQMVVTMVGQHQHVLAKDVRIGRVLLEFVRQGSRCGLRLPPELALLGKTLLQLDHIGRTLNPDFDVNASMRRNAIDVMRRRTLKQMTSGHAFESVLELRDFTAQLPARLNRVFETLSQNDLRVKVDLIDHGVIIDGLQKVANRIALALVLAALIVGAAMLTQVPAPFTLLGYPGIAMLLFVAAAVGGALMTWAILANDVKARGTRR